MKNNNNYKNITKTASTLSKIRVDHRLIIYEFTLKVVKWLCLSINNDGKPSIPLELLEDLCKKLSVRLKSRGIRDTLTFMKATRNNFYNYLSGNPLRHAESSCYGPSQFPSILGPLKKYVDNEHHNVLRLILTILTASRAIKLKSEVDTSSITQPVKGDVPDLTKHMPSFWKDLGYKLSPDKPIPRTLQSTRWMDYRLSRGPNGHALRTGAYEAELIPQELKDSLEIISPGIANRIEGCINGHIHKFMSHWGFPVEKLKGLIRRLSTFPDKEGKMRTIGVLDYWSQMALKPFHLYIGRILEKIRQDCTLNQAKFKELLSGYNGVYYSVDLSSATDRFPLILICQLLEQRLPSNFVNAWKDVMVGYPFTYQGDRFIYQAGTAMGAYSSFNSFALTHHFIIYHCCKELGVVWKTLPYALLGDDIVIGNELVAEMYMEVLKSIHVEYSPAKTHKSKDFYEFAKRIIYKGVEISPFPISSLKESSKNSDILVIILEEVCKRGWDIREISSSVRLYFSIVKEFRSKLCKKIESRSLAFLNVIKLTRAELPAHLVFNDILRLQSTDSEKFEEKHENQCKLIYARALLTLVEKGITQVYNEIMGSSMSSVMKSNTLLKSYYSWCDEQAKAGGDNLPKNYLIINSPIYGAIYALEKEISNERKRVEVIINSKQVEYSKAVLKPRLMKSKVDDLLTLEKDKKKLCNTLREFYDILLKEAKSALFQLVYVGPETFDDSYIIERKKDQLKRISENITPVHKAKLFDRKAKPRKHDYSLLKELV